MKFLISLLVLLSSIVVNSYTYQDILESSLNNYSHQSLDNFDWDQDRDLEDEDDYEENQSFSLILFQEKFQKFTTYPQPTSKIFWPIIITHLQNFLALIDIPPKSIV